VLVPALMHLIGPANWWLPERLHHALPHRSADLPDREAVRA
jgi:RND superfamily putative drug exporter